jgi:hypothetical protein
MITIESVKQSVHAELPIDLDLLRRCSFFDAPITDN